MSLGTLYANQRIRSYAPKALVNYLKLDVKVEEPGAGYEKLFVLNKVPTFVGPKGFKLHEVIAVCFYCKYKFSNLGKAIIELWMMKEFFLNSYPCLNNHVEKITSDKM